MEFTEHYHYSKDTETVFRMFTDKTYVLKKYEALGATNVQVLEFGQVGDVYRIHTKRDVKLNVPGFAQKFLKSVMTIEEVDEWVLGDGDVKEGSYTVRVQGSPIELNGEMVLRPRAGGAEHEVRVLVVVKIPLVGKQIAKFVADDTRNQLTQDYQFGNKYSESF